MADPRIRRALISVYDKTGIVDFARALHDEFGIEIISTGGTAKLLKESDIPVTLVEEVTGFPEMLDGRVKTLHPRIHAAILADRDNPEHMRQLAEQGIEPIDMVVVNLYPFEETVAKPDCTFDEAIEMIDIGGPCLLRAAAKNHKHVLVVEDPGSYRVHLDQFRGWNEESTRRDALLSGAFGAFWTAARYDSQVATWLSTNDKDGLPDVRALHFWNRGPMRYGENPHQHGELLSLHADPCNHDLTCAEHGDSITAKMSFNNYADATAALALCSELTCGTGLKPVECGTGFQPMHRTRRSPSFQPLDDEKHTRRNLPHIQTPGKVYFVTFRLRGDTLLSPEERSVVLDACRFWDGKKMDLHAVVVMPDHVHMLFTPREIARDQWVPLGEVLHSVKRFSAREINKLRGCRGALWLDESFDRIMRNEKEFLETVDYVANNPIKAGLAEDGVYPWWWDEELHRLETGATPDSGPAHRLETGATLHRLQTGATSDSATSDSATPEGTAQRLQGGVTPDSGALVAVFVKHTNACGVGIAGVPIEAYRRAYLGDPSAAMGGILACNFCITTEFAETVMETYTRWGKDAGAGGFFVEVWLAPSFDDAAIDIICSRKDWGKRVRLLDFGDRDHPPGPEEMDFKRIAGGMLMQTPDIVGLNEDQWTVVTERQPTDQEMADLRLAWLVCKHTKSNAVTICADGMLIGNGAGQMSRVMSCRIATWLAAENGHADKLPRSVAASDAFFPFHDGPDILIDAGVKAIIQPGGSKRDTETIDACNRSGVAMVFTGTRHFKH